MLTTAQVLIALIGAGVVLMGARGILAPQATVGFGIPDTPADDPTLLAWLRVKAARDIGCGLVLLVVLLGGTTQLAGSSLVAAALIPVGDALVVLRSGGPRAIGYGVHAATAAVMVAVGVLALLA